MPSKGIVALGFIVGVALVAGVLRFKFYLDPPEDRFTNRINTILANMAIQNMPLESDAVAAPANIFPVTPVVSDAVHYNLSAQYDLGEGIVLDVLVQPEQLLVVLLQGSDLIVQAYDLSWQPIPDSRRVLRSAVQLIGGMPPRAGLVQTTTGYRLVETVAQSDQTYNLVLRHYALDWVEQSSVDLQVGLSVLESSLIRLADDAIWILFNGQELMHYGADGGLIANQTVTLEGMTVCDVILDQTDVVLALESANEILLQKQNQFGVVQQTVALPRPDSGVACVSVQRYQEQFIVQLFDRVVPYTDDLSVQYAALDVASTQFWPQITLGEDQFWLNYSTSTTLGQYTAQVITYAPAAE